MKKFVVVNHITTYKEVEADTREEAIEVALTMSPDEMSERTVVKRKIGDLLKVVQWLKKYLHTSQNCMVGGSGFLIPMNYDLIPL